MEGVGDGDNEDDIVEEEDRWYSELKDIFVSSSMVLFNRGAPNDDCAMLFGLKGKLWLGCW